MEKNLYNIKRDYLHLVQVVFENEGELTPELDMLLKINKQELTEKSINYVAVIKKVNTDISYIDVEIKRLQELKKTRNKIVELLEKNILDAMQLYEIEKIETPLINISLRKSESVVISVAPEDLPSPLQKIKIEPIFKMEIKKLLKNGAVFQGVELVEKQNLQIK
jgi:alpha-N-acetylglucosamine transferase